MRMIFSSRKLWVILLGAILALGYLITVPSPQTAQVLQSGSQRAGEENSADPVGGRARPICGLRQRRD
jgi:hypothetical protein